MAKSLMVALIIFISLVAGFSFSVAAPQIFEADGECTMGDTGLETVAVAQNTARSNARRAASEKAGVFVYSMSETEKGVLTKDQVTILSASLLRIEDEKITPEPIPNTSAVKYICHIKAWIDPDEVLKAARDFSAEKTENQVKMQKDQDVYRVQNETEMVELREQYKKSVDDAAKRQEVAVAIKRNEDKVTASQIYQNGSECYNRGDSAEAIKLYNQAISLDGKYAAPWTGLGWVYSDQEQYAKAAECFQKAIELYDGFAVPYNGLSYAHNYNKDYKKAIEYGEKAIQLDPNYAAAWNNVGLAYSNLGEYGKAVEYYNKAIAIDANDEIPLANLGNVYYKQKEFDKALEYYQKSTAINQSHANVWYNLGNIYGQKGELDKAIDSYKKVTSLDPQNIRSWIILGYLYNSQKKFEDAKRCFKKALKIDPNDVSAWAGLGFAYDSSEDYANSYEAYKKASELEPTNEVYKKNLETAKQKL